MIVYLASRHQVHATQQWTHTVVWWANTLEQPMHWWRLIHEIADALYIWVSVPHLTGHVECCRSCMANSCARHRSGERRCF